MRLDVYHVAYEEANSELIDINGRFDQLRLRKDRLEAVVAAIGPMLGPNSLANAGASPAVNVSAPPPLERTLDPSPSESQPTFDSGGYTFNQITVPVANVDETGGDPFQRRVRNALKFRSTSHEHQDLETAV